MRCSSAASAMVPMTASTGAPFLNIMKVGIDWTSNSFVRDHGPARAAPAHPEVAKGDLPTTNQLV